jgi:hypothetical protein
MKDKKYMKELILSSNNNLKGIEFSIGGETKIISSLKSLTEISNTIQHYVEYVEHWNHMTSIYENFDSTDINEVDDGLYSVGHNLQSFIDDEDGLEIDKKLRKFHFYGDIDIDITRDFVYCYIKDKTIAEKYNEFCYNEIIKPVLDEINNS